MYSQSSHVTTHDGILGSWGTIEKESLFVTTTANIVRLSRLGHLTHLGGGPKPQGGVVIIRTPPQAREIEII